MGNCFSDVAGGRSAVAGTASFQANNSSNAPNEAVDSFLKSRGFNGLYSQIEKTGLPILGDVLIVLVECAYPRGIRYLTRNIRYKSVQLSLSASNLRDRDVLSKSDPSPKWIRKCNITYQFEMVQHLVFHAYDVDTQFHNVDVKMLKLEEQQFLDIPNKLGQLVIYAEESVTSKTTTELVLRCSDLESKDLFLKSDPFLVISKFTESGLTVPICKTEVLKNDHSPRWKPVFLSLQQTGSKDSPLIIECFHFNANGRHDLLGKVDKSLAEMEKLFSAGMGANLFIPPAISKNRPNKVLKSQLFVEKFSEKIQQTFLDYLAVGYELVFMVGIDFTASNGNPRLPDSLHYIDPSGRPNADQRAILDVGEVLQFYDSDKGFPAWGFGARPIDGRVSYCFNLNGSSNCCAVEGVQGILTAYIRALYNVSLAGPTLFGPIVTAASHIASQADGVITYLQETKDAFVKASDLPLSILIVGVGGADFKEMEILDGDKRKT